MARGHMARVRIALVVVALVLLPLLPACGGDDDESATGTPGEVSVELDDAEGGAPAPGARAVLTFESEDRTTIRVDGIDEGEPGGGGANPVRLRTGNCGDEGGVVESLEPVKGTSSETTVGIGLPTLLDGDYSIEIGVPGSREEILACGDVDAPDQ